VNNTEDLLVRCGTPAGRKDIAGRTGISETLLLWWANHVDLMRISGIGPQYAELLEASGVDSVKGSAHTQRRESARHSLRGRWEKAGERLQSDAGNGKQLD
jgi:hypothetical protein